MNSFHQAKAYHEKHGRFPTNADSDEEAVEVYIWIRNQKQLYKKGKLSDVRIDLLESIGVELVIPPKAEVWNQLFDGLSRYVKEHGYFPATNDSKENYEAYRIYRWMLRQRKSYKAGKLITEQIQKLESIGFVLDAAEDLWNRQFAALESYVKQFHQPPTREQDEALYQWYYKQKKYYNAGKLTTQ